MRTKALLLPLLAGTILTACNDGDNNAAIEKKVVSDSSSSASEESSVKEEALTYSVNGVDFKSFVAYDEKKTGKRPIVLILPEWWGLTEYPRMRAKMLAEMGYLAMAVDMYGEGKLANDPKAAQEAAGPFYGNAQMGKERIDAALSKARTLSHADATQAAAIGYCFGGSMALNYAKLGGPVVGVVSFHGGLAGPAPQKGTKAQFLVCHGGADNFVPQPEVDAFRKGMDSAGLAYTFKVYEGATHAFTNPAATEKGKEFNMPIRYNGAADTASWNDMKTFFGKIFRQ